MAAFMGFLERFLQALLKIGTFAIGIVVLLIVVLIVLIFAPPIYMIKDVTSQSHLVGQTLTSEEPLVYKKNLPYFRDVSAHIRRNTPGGTVHTRETSYLLDDRLDNWCHNCMDDERLTTPIRVEFIPAGTVFTVVKEFRLNYVHLFFGSDEFVLVRDDKGNFSETWKSTIDNWEANANSTAPTFFESEPLLAEIVEHLQNNDSAKAEYCPETWTVSSKKVKGAFDELSKFVRDFKLQQDVGLERNYKSSCNDGVLITFETLDAFMTTQYYLSEWSMYGDLKLSR